MSRSYRKPYITEQQYTRRANHSKRRANRAVRSAKAIADGKAYRKLYSSYDIRDWSFYAPKDAKAYRK